MRAKILAIVVLFVVAGGAVIGALGGFSGLSLASSTASATSFLTAAASVATVTDAVSATGSVAAAETWSLGFGAAPSEGTASSSASAASGGGASTSVAWPVTEVKVKVGDAVKKDQILAVADTADLESAIVDATRTVSSATLQLAQANADRAAATTTQQVRQTKQQVYGAQTQLENANAALADLVAERAYASLVAPVDGTVTAVNVRAGADASGTAIALQSATLQVTTSVTEGDISKISIGQKAEVAVSAVSATLQGTVTAISPTPASSGSGGSSSGVVAYPVTIVLDAPPTEVRVGMTADVTITIDSRSNVLSIPSRALSGSAGAYTVRVVANDGSISVVSVQVGLVTSSLAEITSGLTAGQKVVTGTSSTQQTTTTRTQTGGQGFPGGGGFVPGR